MMDIKVGLLRWFTIFDKKSKRNCVNIPLESTGKIAKELHKPIIRNFLKSLFRI